MAFSRARPPADAVDDQGFTSVTASYRPEHPRRGAVYDPKRFAAATPVHFHPLDTRRKVMVFSRFWHSARTSRAHPEFVSEHRESVAPGWLIVDGTGGREVIGNDLLIPGTAGELVAACSLSNRYLFVLTKTAGRARLTHFRWSFDHDTMNTVASERIAAIEVDGRQVVFDRGVFLSGQDLVLVGAAADDDRLFMARKPYGHVGAGSRGAPWRYRGATGWHDAEQAAPIGLSSCGPVSVFDHRGTRYVAVVEADDQDSDGDDLRMGRIYAKRHLGHTWTPHGPQVPLGSVTDGAYLGGTLQFQQAIRASGAVGAVPYVRSVKDVVSDVERIDVSWGTVKL